MKMQKRSETAVGLLGKLWTAMVKRVSATSLALISDPVELAKASVLWAEVANSVVSFHSDSGTRNTPTACRFTDSTERSCPTYGDGTERAAAVTFHRGVRTTDSDEEFAARVGVAAKVLYVRNLCGDKKAREKLIGTEHTSGMPRGPAAINALVSTDGLSVSNDVDGGRGALRCDLLDPSEWQAEISLSTQGREMERGFAGLDKETGEEISRDDARQSEDEVEAKAEAKDELNKREKAEMLEKHSLVPGGYLPKKVAAVLLANQKAKREAYKAEHGESPSKEVGRMLDGQAWQEYIDGATSAAVKRETGKVAKTSRKKVA